MLITAEAVARGAVTRKESRGGHTRLDFEGEREEWSKFNIVSRKGKDGKMEVEQVMRTEPDAELKRIANSGMEDLEKEVAEEKAKVTA